MRIDKRLSIEDSNKKISEMIHTGIPFSVARVGLGGETAVTVMSLVNQQIPKNIIDWFFINAGFYGSNDFLTYANLYRDACRNSDLQAYWNFPGFVEMEDFLVPEDKILIEPGSLESFRCVEPWTKHLQGKKVLIISPFKNSILTQLEKRQTIWKDQSVLPDAEFIVYQSVQSIGGMGPHSSWYESFEIMCQEIGQIDFDVALLGCGSYGLPLTDYIKMKLKKTAIYIGGGLQLYFGIMGKRWEGGDMMKHFNQNWIRPNDSEKPQLGNLVEGGCYW